jgi:hypothetical protein
LPHTAICFLNRGCNAPCRKQRQQRGFHYAHCGAPLRSSVIVCVRTSFP